MNFRDIKPAIAMISVMALVMPVGGVSANPSPAPSGGSNANAGAISGSQSGAVSTAVGVGGQSSSTSGAIGVGGDAFSSSGVNSTISTATQQQQASTSAVTINQSSSSHVERPIIPGEVIVSPTNTTTDCRAAKSGGVSVPFGGIGASGTSVDEDCRFRVRARDMAAYGGDYGLNIACQMYYDHKEYADDVKAAMDKLGVNCRELKRPVPVAAPVVPPTPKQEEEHIDPPALGLVIPHPEFGNKPAVAVPQVAVVANH